MKTGKIKTIAAKDNIIKNILLSIFSFTNAPPLLNG